MTIQQAFRFDGPAKPARRNIVIEAGAGTGKTTAIVAEVLDLLLSNPNLIPERVVLMTFTEKAAGEIAERIHQALGELESQFEGGGDVVWPVKSANPLFRVPANRRDEYRETCRKQLARVDGLRSQTIHSFCQSLLRMFPIEAGLDPQFRIIEGFERSLLYSQLYDKWADSETRANDPRVLAEWESLLAHVDYLFRVRDVVFSLSNRRDLLDDSTYDLGGIDEVAPQIIDAVAKLRGAQGTSALIEYLKANELPPASIDAWIDYFAPVNNEILTIDLPPIKDATVKNAIKALRGTGSKGDSIHDLLVSHRAAVALIALTRRFIAFTDAEKRALGVADFDDLLIRTAALLDDVQIAERIRQQFDHIFVDEFQDTDRTQARIIERLASDRSGTLADGRTLIVGDPKQSIYAFRRADPETYQRFSGRLIAAGADERKLKEQYRSEPALLDEFNSIFARVFENSVSDVNVFRPAYHELIAARKSASDDHQPIRFLLAPDPDNRHISEAETIADWILSRGGKLNQYAILFRRLSKLDQYLDTFDRRGIDYILPQTRTFLDRRAPVDLLAVLRAIAYPFDRGAEISAARTPYFALTDVEIAEGVIANTTAWSEYKAALDRYREESKHRDVCGIIDLLVASCDIESVYAASIDDRRALRHLEHVRSIAFTYDQKSGGSLRQFVAEIDRRRTEPDEMEPSVADADSNAVRILSVHAAKGLEFDTVILPDLSFPRGSDMIQIFAVEDPPSLVVGGHAQTLNAQFRFTKSGAPLKEVAKDRDEAELRRLFYVAVTRAKNEVAFVCNPDQNKEGFFKLMQNTFDNIQYEEVKRSEKSVERKRLRDSELERQLATGDIVPLTSVAASAPARRAPSEGARGHTRKLAGIALHRVLELWDGTQPLERLLKQVATELACDNKTMSAIRNRLDSLRKSASFARIIKSETIARELTIRFVDESGALVERRIDRIIRENDRELVVDYKSGAPTADRVTADKEQVARYCRAVEQMTGRRCTGVLWYIDTDADQIVDVEPVESSANAAAV